MANGWTLERRRRQSELIQTWQPWVKSTGPTTSAGKARSSQNAFKGGLRPLFRMIDRVLRKQQHSLDELSAEFYDSTAERLVDAALDGDLRAILEIGTALDE